jgi:sortase A
MRDKRPVDELSIAELERILAIRKREARQNKIRGYEGRQMANLPAPVAPSVAPEAPIAARQPAPPRPAPQAVPTEPAKPTSADYYQGQPEFEDELDARYLQRDKEAGQIPAKPISLGRVWNSTLVLVEIAAVLGLIFLLFSLFQSFQQVSDTTASLQAEAEATARAAYVAPTATPVISIAAVVLPSGHAFRNGEAVFNLEEVPSQYRDQFVSYTSQLPVQRPTPSPEGPIRIRIARLSIDSAVTNGDDWESLKLGVGHHIGSANPGQTGNMVLSAHNDIYGELFKHLDQLQPGDQIIISTRSRDYTYVVQPQTEREAVKGYRVVLPTDIWVLAPTNNSQQLTLISCYPYRVNTKRIVVFATLLG